MGELMEIGPSGLSVTTVLPMLVALAAVVLFGVFGTDTKNDDDDSSPGGGLMQPVA